MTRHIDTLSRRGYLQKGAAVGLALGVAGCTGDGDTDPAGDSDADADADADADSGSDDGSSFPERNATNVVPYGEGGGTDTYARGIIPHVADELGINVEIANRPGGESIVGVTSVFHAEPDGYEWVLHNLPTTALAWTLNPTDDDLSTMTPICQYGTTPYVWHADPDLGLEHDPQGVVDRYEDGEFTQMGGNLGSGEHLAVAQMRQNGDLPEDFDWIIYDGSGPQLQATAAGEVPVAHATDAAAASAAEEGTVDIVAVLGSRESNVFPEAPNLVDGAGFEEHIGGIDRIAVGPPELPADRRDVLADAFQAAIEGPVQEWSEDTGNEVVFSPPAEVQEQFDAAYEGADEFTPIMDEMVE